MSSKDRVVKEVMTSPDGLMAGFGPEGPAWKREFFFSDKNSSGTLDLGDEFIPMGRFSGRLPGNQVSRVVTEEEVRKYSGVVNPLWRFYKKERTELEGKLLPPQFQGTCIIGGNSFSHAFSQLLTDVKFDPPLQIVLEVAGKVYSLKDVAPLKKKGSC